MDPNNNMTNTSFTTVKTKKDTGMMVGWIVLAILVVAGVGGGVWYWQQTKIDDLQAKNQSLQTQVSDLQKQVAAGQTANAEAEATTDTDLLEIADWGVGIVVPVGLEDLKYVVEDVDGDEKVLGRVAFTTESLEKLDSGCTAKNASLGMMSKVKGQYSEATSPAEGNGGLVEQFDDFYIAYAAPQGVCSDDDEVIAEQSKALKLMGSIESAEEVK